MILDVFSDLAILHLYYIKVALNVVVQLLQKYPREEKIRQKLQEKTVEFIETIKSQDQQKVKLYQQITSTQKGTTQAADSQVASAHQRLLDQIEKNKQSTDSKAASKTTKRTQTKKLSDSVIAQAFDPSKFTDETSQYLEMKENEKKIVNFLQCLILLKQEDIFKFLKDKLCLAFT
jgi:hypothetical protein